MPNHETKAGLLLGCLFIAGFSVALSCGDRETAIPVDATTFNVPNAEERMANLLDAIRAVESGYDDRAFNVKENARGPLQIRPIMVADANRIQGHERWTHDDAWSFIESAAMFETVVLHYGRKYAAKGMSFEEYASRIWNGGGAGPDKESTKIYWHKIQKRLAN